MASDLWAFGVLIYRTMTGEMPFDGRSERGDLQRDHLQSAEGTEALRTPRFAPALPKEFLVKDPKERPKSAVAMAKQDAGP